MLETFQRECVEPPPIRISNVKHKAHSFTLSIKWKQPTYYSVGNWEAEAKNIERISWMEQTSTSAWSETEAWHYAKGQDLMETYNGDEIMICK